MKPTLGTLFAAAAEQAQPPSPSSSAESTMPPCLLQSNSQQSPAHELQGRAVPRAAAGTKAKACKVRARSAGGGGSGRCQKRPCPASSAPGATAAKAAEEECEDEDCDDDEVYAAGGSAGPGERKGPIKHSTVEKQRRDRINTLIDLLAEQVPPSNAKYIGNQAGVRRPKHAVLSDTLALLGKMRATLQEQEARLAQLTAAAPAQPATMHSSDSGSPELLQQAQQPAQQVLPAPPKPQKRPHSAARSRHSRAAKAARPAADAAAELSVAITEFKAECDDSCCLAGLPVPGLPHVVDAQPQSHAGTSTDALNPDVSVSEVTPGRFHVAICCLQRQDLHADVRDGLGNLPLSIDQLSVCDAGSAHTLMHATLQLSSMCGSSVTCDQIQLALYMSVCWGCMQLPHMALPLPLGGELPAEVEALGPLDDVCWETVACGGMGQQAAWGMGLDPMLMHSSPSSTSIDSWIGDI